MLIVIWYKNNLNKLEHQLVIIEIYYKIYDRKVLSKLLGLLVSTIVKITKRGNNNKDNNNNLLFGLILPNYIQKEVYYY